MNTRTKNLLALLAAFGFGAIAGGFGMRTQQLDHLNQLMNGPPSAARRRFMVDVLRHRLALSDTQTEKVRQIFDAHEPERRRASEKCRPENSAVRAQITQEVDALLNPEQRELHRELLKELNISHLRPLDAPGPPPVTSDAPAAPPTTPDTPAAPQ